MTQDPEKKSIKKVSKTTKKVDKSNKKSVTENLIDDSQDALVEEPEALPEEEPEALPEEEPEALPEEEPEALPEEEPEALPEEEPEALPEEEPEALPEEEPEDLPEEEPEALPEEEPEDLPEEEPEALSEEEPEALPEEEPEALPEEEPEAFPEEEPEALPEEEPEALPEEEPEALPEEESEALSEEEFDEHSTEPFNFLDDTTQSLSSEEIAYTMGWRWADFQLYVVSPDIQPIIPPVIFPPEPLLEGAGFEFVYPIHDYGFKLATSKADDMVSSGMSMCKLYYTIEKMIYLLVERLKSGGVSTETEVEIAFAGFPLAQRKAFESIVNLNYNVVVTNFEPGEWGDKYLENVKRLAEKGYGYPPESPRDSYRHQPSTSTARKP